MPWDSEDTTGGLHLRDRSFQSTMLRPCLCSWELPSAAWHQAWLTRRLSQHRAGLAPLLRPLRPRRARPWVPGPAPAPRQGRGDTGRTAGRISVSSAWDLRVNLPPFILQLVNTQHPGDVAEYFWITEGYRGLQAGAGDTAMLGPPSPAQLPGRRTPATDCFPGQLHCTSAWPLVPLELWFHCKPGAPRRHRSCAVAQLDWCSRPASHLKAPLTSIDWAAKPRFKDLALGSCCILSSPDILLLDTAPKDKQLL